MEARKYLPVGVRSAVSVGAQLGAGLSNAASDAYIVALRSRDTQAAARNSPASY
jgi:hypothetical protein